MPNHYLAITIGPIYKLLKKAKTIREFWVASYFLSKVAKTCMDYTLSGTTLLSPQKVTESTQGAGVYPDRVYWKLENVLEEGQIQQIQEEVLKKLSQETNEFLTVSQLSTFLKTYWLQVSYSQEEIDEKPFLFRINETLDALELQDKWEMKPEAEVIEQLIAKGKGEEYQRPVHKWRKESGQRDMPDMYDYGNVKRFPSIIEITTCSLKNKQNSSDWYRDEITNKIAEALRNLDSKNKGTQDFSIEDDYISKIKAHYKKDFYSHHKYICIIQSDGDGVGAFLKNKVGNVPTELEKFSKKLNEFAIHASQTVRDYGGVPVFAGGDDLLFLAPVMHQRDASKSIIHLLDTLNGDFKAKFPGEGMTQSFGVSITYYKHPMAEALQSAVDLLLHTAKKQPCKNYIAMKVQKHSGQTFEFGFRQEGALYECFLQLIEASQGTDANFLNSVMYKLNEQQELLGLIAQKPDKLKLFFDENFNEAGHKKHEEKFFKQVANLITHTFITYKDTPKETVKTKMFRLYSALRFIHFLNAKDTDE